MILGFFRALIGCWHDWGRWVDAPIINEFGRRGIGQKRVCAKCGKASLRYMN